MTDILEKPFGVEQMAWSHPVKPDIYFDIDGVVRDLLTPFGANPIEWDFTHNGQSIIEFYDHNLGLLETAPETEYYEAIVLYAPKPSFITCCKAPWIKPTFNWLDSHFTKISDFYVVDSPEKKLFLLEPGDLLVEDYPNFSDYSQIILIDRPYNQDVDCKRRVKTPEELVEYLK